MDDAAFYAANSLISDRFLLTTAFNLHFTRPMRPGQAIAEGRWISGRRRVLIADAHIVGPDGEEAARGTGTFLRSHISLSSLAGLFGLMAERLPAHVEVTAIMRRVEADGGFATVLRKGDPDRGALILVLQERGRIPRDPGACDRSELHLRVGLTMPASSEIPAANSSPAGTVRRGFVVN